MKPWINETIFKTWTDAQKRLWDSLCSAVPFQPPAGVEAWRETYLKNLATWEAAVRQTLAQEALAHKDKIPFNWYMLIEHAQTHMQFDLNWMQQLIDTVKKVERWTPEWQCPDCAATSDPTGATAGLRAVPLSN